MMTFGAKIKQLRLNSKYSITEAAFLLGINKGSLSRYEHDLVEPSLNMAKRIAVFYNVTLDFLADIQDRT